MVSLTISSEMKERIIQTANNLFETNNRESFPSVDQVRRAARVDMNAASAVMKEWRKQQTSQAGKITVTIPERVQSAFQGALAVAWSEAQDMANEALTAAQNAWDEEREDSDKLRTEIAVAFEDQEKQLQEVKGALERSEKANQSLEADKEQLKNQIDGLKAQIQELHSEKTLADQKASSAAIRIEELKDELSELKADNRRLIEKLSDELESLRKNKAN